MFGKNVAARFQTGKGSTYVVDESSVTRDKPADPDRKTERKEKNIYYQTKEETDTLEKYANLGWDPAHMEHVQGDDYQLTLKNPEDPQHPIIVKMTSKPAEGLYPLDLFLESDGATAADDGMHFGNKIVKME